MKFRIDLPDLQTYELLELPESVTVQEVYSILLDLGYALGTLSKGGLTLGPVDRRTLASFGVDEINALEYREHSEHRLRPLIRIRVIKSDNEIAYAMIDRSAQIKEIYDKLHALGFKAGRLASGDKNFGHFDEKSLDDHHVNYLEDPVVYYEQGSKAFFQPVETPKERYARINEDKIRQEIENLRAEFDTLERQIGTVVGSMRSSKSDVFRQTLSKVFEEKLNRKMMIAKTIQQLESSL